MKTKEPALPRLYGSPEPIMGEAASSWLQRVASRHGVSVAELLYLMLPIQELIDPDTSWKMCLTAKIAAIALVEETNILHATRYTRNLLRRPEYRWITWDEVGDTPIFRYCHRCLGEGRIAFFRLSWRLASSVVCEHHDEFLRGACWHCNAKLNWLPVGERVRRVAPANVMRFCRHCGADLAEAPSQVTCSTDIAAVRNRQDKFTLAAHAGVYRHPTLGAVSSAVLFESCCRFQPLLEDNVPTFDVPRAYGLPPLGDDTDFAGRWGPLYKLSHGASSRTQPALRRRGRAACNKAVMALDELTSQIDGALDLARARADELVERVTTVAPRLGPIMDEAFATVVDAANWLMQGNAALDGRSPVSCVRSEDAARLVPIIERILSDAADWKAVSAAEWCWIPGWLSEANQSDEGQPWYRGGSRNVDHRSNR